MIAQVDFREMAQEPDIGIALGWVMVMHDVSTLLRLQDFLTERIGRRGASRKFLNDARFLVNRTLAIPVNEAVAMTLGTRQSTFVMGLIDEFREAREAFDRLHAMALAGYANSEELAVIRDMRNRGTAHYFTDRDRTLPEMLQEALNGLIATEIAVGNADVDSDEIIRRFDFVDAIYARVVTHSLWRLGDNRPVRDIAETLVSSARDVESIGQPVGVALLHRFRLDAVAQT